MRDDHIKLTVLDMKFENMVAKTPAGMAHWASTGPRGTTCRECGFYQPNGYSSSKTAKGGLLKNGPCKKYIDMTGVDNKKIPFDTPSCKYFEKNPHPPTITDQRK